MTMKEAVSAVEVFPAAGRGANATSGGIDTWTNQGRAQALALLLSVGAVAGAAPTLDVRLQHADNDVAAQYTDVPGGAVPQLVAAGFREVNVRRFKRYVRVIGVVGGAAAAASRLMDSAAAGADVLVTADTPGSLGNDITIQFRNPAAASAALAVTVGGPDGRDIVVSLATDAAGAITTTASAVVTALNAAGSAQAALVTASLPGTTTGAGVVSAIAAGHLAGGADLALTYGLVALFGEPLDAPI